MSTSSAHCLDLKYAVNHLPNVPLRPFMSSLLDSPTLGISLAVAVAGIVVASKWKGSQSLPYPPGPPPDPFIGNARAMASDELERVFAAWGKEYGVFHLDVIYPDPSV